MCYWERSFMESNKIFILMSSGTWFYLLLGLNLLISYNFTESQIDRAVLGEHGSVAFWRFLPLVGSAFRYSAFRRRPHKMFCRLISGGSNFSVIRLEKPENQVHNLTSPYEIKNETFKRVQGNIARPPVHAESGEVNRLRCINTQISWVLEVRTFSILLA